MLMRVNRLNPSLHQRYTNPLITDNKYAIFEISKIVFNVYAFVKEYLSL